MAFTRIASNGIYTYAVRWTQRRVLLTLVDVYNKIKKNVINVISKTHQDMTGKLSLCFRNFGTVEMQWCNRIDRPYMQNGWVIACLSRQTLFERASKESAEVIPGFRPIPTFLNNLTMLLAIQLWNKLWLQRMYASITQKSFKWIML